MRPVEEDLQFEGVEVLEEPGQVLLKFLFDPGLGRGRLGLAQLDHHAEIFKVLFGLEKWFDLVAKGIGLVDELLGLFAAVPETLRRHQGVEFAQAFLRAGQVKETSASGPIYRPRWSVRL